MPESMQNCLQQEPAVSQTRRDQRGLVENQETCSSMDASPVYTNSFMNVPEKSLNCFVKNAGSYEKRSNTTILRDKKETIITMEDDFINSSRDSPKSCLGYKKKFLDIIMCSTPTKLTSLVINIFNRLSSKRMLFLILLAFIWIGMAYSHMNKRVELTISTPYNQALTFCLYNCDEIVEKSVRSNIVKVFFIIILQMCIYFISPFCSNFGFNITINFNQNSMYV